MLNYLNAPTRNLFFTGKGGVGKTSIACATSLQLSDQGSRVLLVSTDPASNLDEVLGAKVGQPSNSDPRPAQPVRHESRSRTGGGRVSRTHDRTISRTSTDAALKGMEEQFSGACTVEIAAFNEFSRLLGDPASSGRLSLCHLRYCSHWPQRYACLHCPPPGMRSCRLARQARVALVVSGTSVAAKSSIRIRFARFSDPATTTLVLVARADTSALREAARTSAELAAFGIQNQHLVINGVFKASDLSDLTQQLLNGENQPLFMRCRGNSPHCLSRSSRFVPML